MTFTIPDQVINQVGLTDRQLLVELACWLFDSERLTLWPAAQVAGLNRVQFEHELRVRKIPIHRPTIEDLRQDLETIEHLEQVRRRERGDAA